MSRALARPLLAVVAATSLLTAGALPAAADHVSPRDVEDACPADRPTEQDRYADVQGTTFESEIACVSDYAIALGTGERQYSPSAPITRQQMALFLYRLALSAHLPLQAANNQFSDVDQLPQAVRDAINVISHLGITQGAAGGRFEPAATVSRGQMASFLNRFHAVASGTDGFPAGPDAFDDDSGSVHESAINAAAAAGIAAGLGGEQDRLFAPTRSLTRGQMAGFLARLLDAEVEDGTIGSRFVEPEQVDGVVVSEVETGNRIGLDTDGDGAADRVVYYDGNDDYLFGDERGTVEEFYDLNSWPRVLSEGDRLSVSYLPNFFDTSTVQVVDDLVSPAYPVIATALVGEDGVQDDVRVVWANASDNAIVTRFRSPVRADETCSTDVADYVEAGTVDAPRVRSTVLDPESDPATPHPAVVDESVPQGCSLYSVESTSDRVEGSTPAQPTFTNPVLVDRNVDTQAPQVTRAEVVAQDGQAPRIVLTFGNEDQVRSFGPGLSYLWCVPPGHKNGFHVGLGLESEDGARLTYRVGEELRTEFEHCDPELTPLSVVDAKGNANASYLGAPLE